MLIIKVAENERFVECNEFWNML